MIALSLPAFPATECRLPALRPSDKRMLLKIFAVVALVTLPMTVTFWYRSHSEPVRYRWDLTEYKSIEAFLHDGICGLHVLSMPTLSRVRSEFTAPLRFNAVPNNASLLLSSRSSGDYRHTWLVFPFWLPTVFLIGCAITPLLTGPIRRWRRVRKGLCIYCGYDLRGSRNGICPECGGRSTSRAGA